MFVKLEDISKHYKEVRAVDGMSLEFEKGQITCLLGPSGCGKTTTLKAIGGFLKLDAGRIIIDGEDITNMPPENRPTSTVFQSYALFPHMTVLKNVIYGLKFKGFTKKEALLKGEEYLSIVGLENLKDRNVQKLSGGQQQRVALARALVVNPKVLLLDEPLSNLDAKLRVKMREEIKEIQQKIDITMIFVTHDQEEALHIADRIAVMNDGRLEQVANPREIYSKPKSKFVLDFIGNSNIVLGANGEIGFVRPEESKLSRTKGDITGFIESKTFSGPYLLYKVATDTQVLNVQVLNVEDGEFEPGEKVYLSLKIRELS